MLRERNEPLVFLLILLLFRSALAHEDLSDQIQKLTQKIQKEPDNALLYFERGELYRARNAFQKAESDYFQASRLDPELYTVDFSLGLLNFERGNPVAAERYLTRFLDRHPDHARGLVARARVWNKVGKPDSAVTDYTKALSLEPQAETYLERSNVQISQNRHEQALAGLEEGLQRLGSLVILESAAIELERSLARYDSALRRIDLVIHQMERKESWLVQKGEILEEAGRKQDAMQAFSEAASAIHSLPASRRNARSVKQLETQIQSAISRLSEPNSKGKHD